MAKDRGFSKKAIKKITQSAANTLTFAQLDFNIGIQDKAAMLIQRIEWHLGSGVKELAAATDSIVVALCATNMLASLPPDNPAIISILDIEGIGATVELGISPQVMDFSGLASGGLLVSPLSLFLAIGSSGMTAALTPTVWIFYEVIPVTDVEALTMLAVHLPSTI